MTGPLTIKHEHGSVDVRGAAGLVTVRITSGDVHVGFRTLPTEGTLRLRTANSDVSVALPPGDSARVEARTNGGVIRVRGVSPVPKRFVPVHAGARYEAQMGQDGPPVELRTKNGDITLRGADTTRVDSIETAPPAEIPVVSPPDTTVPPRRVPDTTSPDTGVADTTQS